jgi:hypothetical protein
MSSQLTEVSTKKMAYASETETVGMVSDNPVNEEQQ